LNNQEIPCLPGKTKGEKPQRFTTRLWGTQRGKGRKTGRRGGPPFKKIKLSEGPETCDGDASGKKKQKRGCFGSRGEKKERNSGAGERQKGVRRHVHIVEGTQLRLKEGGL